MDEQRCTVSFGGTNYAPLTLTQHQNLSEYLTVQNSPVLFGCRTGICGTCLVVVEGDIPAPSKEEKEILETLAPGNNQVRLACQINLTTDIAIAPFAEEQ